MYWLPYVIMQYAHRAAINARRRDRTWHYFAWSVIAGLTTGAMFAIGASFVWLLWSVGLWWMALVIALIAILPVVANTAVRHLLVPLGLPRLTYYVAIVSRPGTDAPAYGLCAAAWAFMHRPAPKREAWLAARRDARLPLGDAEVVVTAFLAAAKGDLDTARSLLASVDMLVESHPAVRELVGEWLAVDAAERGAWRELAEASAAARWPASPLTYFLEGVALVRTGAPGAPQPFELHARWLLAPHRLATRELLAAPAPPPPAPRPIAEPEAGAQAESAPLPRAVAAHLAFAEHEPSTTSLADTVRAWDAALADGATHAWLARRALELDAPLGAVDRALREVAGKVTDELAQVADAAKLGAPPSHGPVGDGLSRRLRHGRLDALETGFDRWANRRTDGAVRAGIDEWREFLALHAAYNAVVTAGGTELRRLAFPHAFSTGSNMAAWLWNSRNEYALSHAISKWLLAEALAVGDTEAIELGHRNCGLSVPTRLGNIG